MDNSDAYNQGVSQGSTIWITLAIVLAIANLMVGYNRKRMMDAIFITIGVVVLVAFISAGTAVGVGVGGLFYLLKPQKV